MLPDNKSRILSDDGLKNYDEIFKDRKSKSGKTKYILTREGIIEYREPFNEIKPFMGHEDL